MNSTQTEEVLKAIEDGQILVDDSTSQVLDALKEEQLINLKLSETLKSVSNCIDGATEVIKLEYAAITTLRTALLAIHQHYGFSRKSLIKLIPTDTDEDEIVMEFGELMENAENLADKVARLLCKTEDERPPTMEELDESCGTEFVYVEQSEDA
jgi:hypothetical protein